MVPFNAAPTITAPTAPIVTAPVTTPSSTPAPVNAVSPSFSIVQIANNASGNPALPQNTPSSSPAAAPTPQISASSASNLASRSGPISTTNFLAQIIGQESSVSSQTVLVQYEKLVYFSTIKYKPSNAQKPQPQPADVFSKIVAQQQSDDQQVQVQVQQQVRSTLVQQASAQATSTQSGATTNAQAISTPSIVRLTRAQPTAEEDIQAEEAAVIALKRTQAVESTPAASKLLAASAYLRGSVRVEAQADTPHNISNVA